MKIHVLGDAFADVVAHGISTLPTPGNGTRCNGVMLCPGGSALNTAVHLASLLKSSDDHKVVMFSALGEDENDWASQLLRKHLSLFNIEFVISKIPKANTGVCVVLSLDSDRSFITNPGAVSKWTLDGIDLKKLADCDHLHIGGVYSLEGLFPSLATLCLKVREMSPNITISMDTNVGDDDNSWGAPGFARDVFPLIDYLKVNDMEAVGLHNAHNNPLKTDKPDVALVWLAEIVRRDAIVTLGELGCRVRQSKESLVTSSSSPTVKVLDAVGAGDAFNAGWIYKRVVLQCEVAKAAEFACACGALAVTRIGACQSPVEFSSVEALLEGEESRKKLKLL